MARKISTPTGNENIAKELIPTKLADEISTSFADYSLSVVTSRALPDVTDGLKPVQRRILWAMYRLGLSARSEHRKCAYVVGETMGKYHPHGDSSIYQAMVRMGQDFVCNVPLVDPRGNFGSLDDPPGAYRYTEARLTPGAMRMLQGIEENAVDLIPSFDGSEREPEILPAGFPQLLVNGCEGIAVGVRTHIPPHNLNEVVDALEAVLRAGNKPIPVKKLMEFIPGPDFASGCEIPDSEGIRELYETGVGSFMLRSRVKRQQIGHRTHITITELPHQIGAEAIVSAVRTAKEKNKIEGIISVDDLSDRDSDLRIVVVAKKGVNSKEIIKSLYKTTPLERKVSCHMMALHNGKPTTMSLWEILRAYADHRLVVTVRRAEFVLAAAEREAHKLRGLLAAIDRIDEVIAVIRDPSNKSSEDTRTKLCDMLNIDDTQAKSVLAMTLNSLQALKHKKLLQQLDKQEKIIKDRKGLLASPTRQRNETIKLLKEAAEELSPPRRTRIIS